MVVNIYNPEGYLDLTAYEALKNIDYDGRKQNFRPIVFICSPFAGDVDRNIQKAQGYSRFAVSRNCIPFAPHLLFPQFMDDDDKEERKLGIFFGLVLLTKCHEVWVFGRNITKGMTVEIEKAKERNMSVRYFTDHCEEVEAL